MVLRIISPNRMAKIAIQPDGSTMERRTSFPLWKTVKPPLLAPVTRASSRTIRDSTVHSAMSTWKTRNASQRPSRHGNQQTSGSLPVSAFEESPGPAPCAGQRQSRVNLFCPARIYGSALVGRHELRVFDAGLTVLKLASSIYFEPHRLNFTRLVGSASAPTTSP